VSNDTENTPEAPEAPVVDASLYERAVEAAEARDAAKEAASADYAASNERLHEVANELAVEREALRRRDRAYRVARTAVEQAHVARLAEIDREYKVAIFGEARAEGVSNYDAGFDY
jgi:hypothetical protein